MVGHLLEYHPGGAQAEGARRRRQLGKVFYVYANRLNLGKVRTDENALWSLGPHDISVLNYLTGEEPEEVSARGECYLQDEVEDVVFGYIKYPSGMIGHLHVSWLDPHKSRKITVVGSDKMVVFDDMEAERKVTIYDKGATTTRTKFETYGEFVTLHFGDIHIPKIGNEEPLRVEAQHFVDCIRDDRQPLQRRPRRAQRGARARRDGAQPAQRRPAGQDGGPGLGGAMTLKPGALGHNLLLGDNVTIGKDVVFGANVVVYDDTVIGDGCFIQDNAVLGKVPSLSPTSTAKRGELPPLTLGAGCVVSTGAVVYRGTTLGAGCILGDYAGVRERCMLGERVVVGRGSVRRERHHDRRRHQDPDQRLHHRVHDDRGPRASSRPACRRPTTTSWAAPRSATSSIKGATIRRGARVGGGVVLLPGDRDRRRGVRRRRRRGHQGRAGPQGPHGRAGARRARRLRGRVAREPVGGRGDAGAAGGDAVAMTGRAAQPATVARPPLAARTGPGRCRAGAALGDPELAADVGAVKGDGRVAQVQRTGRSRRSCVPGSRGWRPPSRAASAARSPS